MNMQQCNSVLRYCGTALGAVALGMCLLRPEWEIRLLGGQVMRPCIWLWQQPDLHLVTEVASGINYLKLLSSAIGIFVCTYFWWWLGGRRRKAEYQPA